MRSVLANTRTPLILYHAGCMDGFAAACVIMHNENWDAEPRAVRYGDPLPPPEDVENRLVFVVDFSYPLELMVALAQRAVGLVWLDHHEGSRLYEEELRLLPNVFTWWAADMSGAGIARYLAATNKLPRRSPSLREPTNMSMVSYVQDRDLWKWDLVHSREINAVLQATFGGYLNDISPAMARSFCLMHADLNLDIVAVGELLLDAQQARVERQARVCTTLAIELPGMMAPVHVAAVNATSDIDELADYLLRDDEDEAVRAVPQPDMAVIFYQAKPGVWKHSARARGAVDCNAFAKLFGGGGHKNAAGFTCPYPITDSRWLSLITEVQP